MLRNDDEQLTLLCTAGERLIAIGHAIREAPGRAEMDFFVDESQRRLGAASILPEEGLIIRLPRSLYDG